MTRRESFVALCEGRVALIVLHRFHAAVLASVVCSRHAFTHSPGSHYANPVRSSKVKSRSIPDSCTGFSFSVGLPEFSIAGGSIPGSRYRKRWLFFAVTHAWALENYGSSSCEHLCVCLLVCTERPLGSWSRGGAQEEPTCGRRRCLSQLIGE